MLHHPAFDPVAIQLGPLKVHWYGLMYLLAFISAWWLASRRARSPGAPVTADQLEDLIFYGALGVVLGGRLGYVVLYGAGHAHEDALWILRIWEGGMSFHGGLLGVMLAMWWFARRNRQPFGTILDFVAPIVPLGLGFGRIGNFIGQELWGRPTELPWGMVFPRDPLGLARHPSQLYQAFLEGVVLFAILWWFSSRPRPRWAVGAVFIGFYGAFRILVEFVREPDAGIGFIAFGWLTLGQLYSLPMVIGGIALLVWAHRREASTGARA